MRLVVTLLLLVVLPTALLSVLAGRSIQARELILHRRLEQDAIRQINRVCETVETQLHADAARVDATFRETLLSGAGADGTATAAHALRGQCSFVKRVFLFLNPWGFVFPSVPAPAADGPQTEYDVLREDLLELISLAGNPHESKLSLHREGEVYCFRSMSGFTGMHSGFELDVAAVLDRLDGIVSEHVTEDIGLRVHIEAGLARSGVNPREGVLVSDTFSSQPEQPRPVGAGRGGVAGALASGGLPDPFSHIQVEAYLVREDDIRQAEMLEARLIGWGILLLAVVIVASSTILIRKAISQAAQTRQRTEFVIGMSHDLRTPVASMRVLADSLCAGRVQSPEKQQHFLRTIASECERLGDMIERILFFFRQEQRALSYTMATLDVSEIVSHTVTAWRARQHGRVTIDLDLADATTCVKGDGEALAKVITNLLDNAVKYGVRRGLDRAAAGEMVDSDGGPGVPSEADIEVRVRSVCRRGRHWVVTSVMDHGPGIPLPAQGKIFDRFYRHDSEDHRHVGGIGLGLFLCMDIAKAHRGRMTVESQPGEGAVFSLWLRSCAC
ncbi:MAG: HAMP domain-containing histidine kinase [Verrucomicrobia bacterium]|jgi:signal transduction histidine kinase|nr:HAMP domain-containing histidine kinase [Verrucomicrobiota bacterium]